MCMNEKIGPKSPTFWKGKGEKNAVSPDNPRTNAVTIVKLSKF